MFGLLQKVVREAKESQKSGEIGDSATEGTSNLGQATCDFNTMQDTRRQTSEKDIYQESP